MLDIYEITSYDQAKVLADKLRLKIMTHYEDGLPKTAKQIADLLELPASKVHYHVRELVKVGLLELVDTKEKNGIMEKYYLPIAKEFRIRLREVEGEYGAESARYKLTKKILQDFNKSYLSALKEADETKKQEKEDNLTLSLLHYHLTAEQYQEFRQDIQHLMEKWANKLDSNGKSPDSLPYEVLCSIYPTEK